MPEVNLKDYFNRLDNLLGENAADEVIHHCRHILRYYPKNVDTYRFLGQALVVIGRWDEAQAALRRVLSVLPNDYKAHVLLGEVFDHTNRCDDAIWHLERALDQRPSEKALLDALRVLYHRCRQTGQLKIQMTAGSVAQQHHRSGSDEYAIETLRSALKQAPDRVDLRLMMAEILWDMGREDEAADNALDVLKVLPDCLSANRILAQLWLSVDRPSDAQQYVNRVESVDPYLAVELVQGTPPEDDAFGVDELDFKRSAQTAVVSERLNWLTDLGASSLTEEEADSPAESWSSGMLSSQPKTAAPEPVEQNDLDWLSTVPVIGGSNGDSDSDAFRPKTGDLMSTDELENLFGNTDIDSAAPNAPYNSSQPAIPDEEDPFAWMGAAGVEISDEPISDEPVFASFFDEADGSEAPILDQNINPLAWMESYGGSDLVIDEPQAQSDEPPPYYTTSDSPQANAYELPPYPNAAEPQNTLEELDWLRSGADDTPFDSFAESTAPTYEAPSVEEFTAPPSNLRGLTSILNEANLDWLQKPGEEEVASEEELDDWLNQFEPATPRKPVTDNPDWIASLDEKTNVVTPIYDPYASDDDDNGAVLGVAFDSNEEELDWMSESERPENQEEPEKSDVPDWLSEFEPKNEPTASPASASTASEADDGFSWSNLSTYEESDDEQVDSLGGVPDWLREAAPLSPEAVADNEATIGGTDFDWLTDDAVASAETEASASDDALLEPDDDWLSQFAPEADVPAVAPVLESSIEPEAEAADLDWLNDLGGAAAQPSAEPVTDAVGDEFVADLDTIPDWLSEMEPAASESPVSSIAAPTLDETPDWLSEVSPALTESPVSSISIEEPSLDDIPDWLSEVSPEVAETPVSSTSLESPIVDDARDWLADLQPAAAIPASDEDESEPLVADSVPDWLTEVQPEEAVAAVAANELSDADETFDWLDAMPAVELPETSLSDEIEASLDDSFGALPEVTPLEEEAELNDWLAGLAPVAATSEAAVEVEAEELSTLDDEIDWEPTESESLRTVGEFAADTGDEDANDAEWSMPSPEFENGEDTLIVRPDASDLSEELEGIITEGDFEAAFPDLVADPALDSVDEFDDLSVDEPEEDVTEAENSEFLGEESEFEPFHEGDAVHSPADNAPDWLNAMVPGLDVDYEAQENVLPEEEFEEAVLAASHLEPEPAGEFGWLERIVDEELEADTAALAAAGPRFVFSRQPAWMRQAAQPDDDLPDWPVDSDGDDTPDWLR